jgi:short-subunit dehydrogenase
MKGRCIIVSGSSSGIGKSISEILLEAGAEVIGLARNHNKFVPESKNYKPHEVDISDVGKLSKLFSMVLSSYPKVDGFVSSAGFGDFNKLENFSPEQIISYVNTNLVSHMILTKLLIPKMKRHNSGKIIFIGSEAALRGSQKGSLYSAVKFGLRGFSQAVREECSGSKVHVSLINPGMVRTNFFKNLNFSPGDDPSNAIEPYDVAQLVLSIFGMRDGTVIDEINLSPLNKVIKFNP